MLCGLSTRPRIRPYTSSEGRGVKNNMDPEKKKRMEELSKKESLTQEEAKELFDLKAEAAKQAAGESSVQTEVKSLVDDIGKKLVDAISAAKGDPGESKEKLAKDPKINPFAINPKTTKEIQYPSD